MRTRVLAVAAVTIALVLGGCGSSDSGSKTLAVRAAQLTKVNETTWRGDVTSAELGDGSVTLTGTIAFDNDGVADSEGEHATFKFRATFGDDFLSGCFENDMLLRPHDRQVWDGLGKVTATSRSLERYRGQTLGEGGTTPAGDLTYAKPWRFDVITDDVTVNC